VRRLVIVTAFASTPVPVLLALAACGGAPPPASRAPDPPGAPGPRVRADDPEAIDPIEALAPGREGEQVSYLVPGRMQIDLGGTAIDDPGDERPLEVGVIQRAGNLVRVAVRLPHARLSVWTDRARLYAVLSGDQRLSFPGVMPVGGPPGAEVQVTLRAGARVRRLAHKAGETRVRYVGAVQVESWVPDKLLTDSGPRRDSPVRYGAGRRPLHVMPGAVIRAEPRWSALELAIVAEGYLVDAVREVDAAWAEVTYADGDVSVHGYLSRQAPPGRVYRPRDPDVPLLSSTPNTPVASGTCLYARARGEAIGYIVGDREVQLDDRGNGWWTLTIDSPWGPLELAARGGSAGELVACAPAGSVPPPAGSAPPPTP
jgi:hypothetical protein